jgi:uncharacterized protein YutE (UPF0331/DUF86 family)
MDDVLLGKAATIERCLARIEEEYDGDAVNLQNITKQDSIVLNLQRACEAAIDGAMRLVRTRALGVPQDSRTAFDLLVTAGLFDVDLAARMKKMVGFRNLAVHDYTRLDLAIVQAIIERHLGDLREYARFLVSSAGVAGNGAS